MTKKSYLLSLLLFIHSGISFPQNFSQVEQDASDYFLSIADGSDSSALLLERLENDIHSPFYASGAVITPGAFDSLAAALNSYKKELEKVSADSAAVLFNSWYLMLSNAFYEHNKQRFFTEGKKKIILFSTSMSCYCTLEMCRKQTIEIMKFARENGSDYWIIDSYEHNDLQLKYETLFAPSVLLFDGGNNIMGKIEYEDEMITKLNNFYTQREKQ